MHALTRAPAAPRGTPAGTHRGMTIIEVMVAMFLLTVGLLALAGLAASASKAVRAGGIQTIASALAQSRFDSLSSVPCATLATTAPTRGSATTREIRESWIVTDGRNVKRLADTVRVPGRRTPLVFVSVIPCRD